ncbi:MAG: HEAT repeat domain-containing protein [Thermodesulfobacteriota bacterium]
MNNLKLLILPLGIILISTFSPVIPPAKAGHQLSPEAWIEIRKMYRQKIPPTTIAEEITALTGNGARQAGPKLIDRGNKALPDIHEALLQPDLPPLEGLRLLQVIGPIGGKSSVPVLLKILRSNPDSPLRRDMLLTLAKLPTTVNAAKFITALAADEKEPWKTRRMAFTWFGLHRDKRGLVFAETLKNDPDPGRQAAGIYVLARLEDRSVLDSINRIFTTGAPANLRDTLMISIAELTSPEEFKRLAPSSLNWSSGYKNALTYSRYREAKHDEKKDICQEMLKSSSPGHLTLAVRCLLESGNAEALRPHAALSLEAPGRDALIRNEIRKAGWQIIDTDDEFLILPPDAANR